MFESQVQALHRKNICPPTCEQLAFTKKGEGLLFVVVLAPRFPWGFQHCGQLVEHLHLRSHPFRSWACAMQI